MIPASGTATSEPKSAPIVVINAARLPSRSAATTWVVPCTPPVDWGRAGCPGASHGAVAAIGRGAAWSGLIAAARSAANDAPPSSAIGSAARSGSSA